MGRPIPVREPGKTISIYDWFDPHDLGHLRAYHKLQTTGCWPEDFPPDHVELSTNWQLLLMSKMSDAWVEEKLSRKENNKTSSSSLEPGV
jgi:hypothetical protein